MPTVSTKVVPRLLGEEYWRANTLELFGPVELQSAMGPSFQAQIRVCPLADMTLCKLVAGPHRVTRSASLARRYDRGYLKALLQIRGTSLLEQDDQTTFIHEGEWSIYDTGRPYSVDVLEESEMVLLLLPREHIFRPQSNLRRLSVRKFSGCDGMGRLTSQFIRNTFDELDCLESLDGYEISEVMAQMIRMTLFKTLAESPSVCRDQIRERVKSYIAIHLKDPDLSIDDIAAAIRCTKRYLHKVFEDEKISLSEYILRQRLEHCRHNLLETASRRRSITDIAYSWGFKNSNHFSRCFKETFGVAPREARLNSLDQCSPNATNQAVEGADALGELL